MRDLGTYHLRSNYPRHGWGDFMSDTMLKASITLKASAISRTTAIPASASDNDTYIDPATDKIYHWLNGEWNTITPIVGAWFYIADTNTYASFNSLTGWVTAVDLDNPNPPVERGISFYGPGRIRPNRQVFRYVAAIEFTVPANMAGSYAYLDIAPTDDLVFGVDIAGKTGTITFATGQTTGVIDFPHATETVVPYEVVASQYSSPGNIIVTSPADTFEAEGLSIAVHGTIRSLP